MSVRTWTRPKERRSKAPTIIQRDRAIEKAALVESAERIYLRYLLPGAEKEIYLPYVSLCHSSCARPAADHLLHGEVKLAEMWDTTVNMIMALNDIANA